MKQPMLQGTSLRQGLSQRMIPALANLPLPTRKNSCVTLKIPVVWQQTPRSSQSVTKGIQVNSTLTHVTDTVLLQTVTVWAIGSARLQIVHCLLGGSSQWTLVMDSIAKNLHCKVIGKECPKLQTQAKCPLAGKPQDAWSCLFRASTTSLSQSKPSRYP